MNGPLPAEFHWIREQQRIQQMQAFAAAAALAAQQQAAQHEHALRVAKDQMRSEGATCEIDNETVDGALDSCRVPAAGRCARCVRAYCESHRGGDRIDLCLRCHEADQARLAEATRAEEERAAVANAARERAERHQRATVEAHAARVATRESRAGGREELIRRRDAAKGRTVRRRPFRPVRAILLCAATTLFTVPFVNANLTHSTGNFWKDGRNWFPAVIVAVGALLVWIALQVHGRRRRDAAMVELLGVQAQFGCGEPRCPMCEYLAR